MLNVLDLKGNQIKKIEGIKLKIHFGVQRYESSTSLEFLKVVFM